MRTIEELAEADAGRAFDLSSDLLLRLQVFRQSEEVHQVLFNMHHIASDGWSISILVREFSELYRAFSQGKPDPLPGLKVQYADYAQWQRDWLQGDVLEAQLGYWQQQLEGLPQLHSLPLDRQRPAEIAFVGDTVSQLLDEKLSARIGQLCKQHNVTLFMFLQTAFAVLLSRYSNETDIVMGSPIAGRVSKETEGLIGFFVNALVLRTDLSGAPDFSALLQRNRQMILDAYTHQHIPFELLVEKMQPERSLAYSPLFQITITLGNHQKDSMTFESMEIEGLKTETNNIKFDLQLNVNETDDGITIDWIYNQNLFQPLSIQKLSSGLNTLIEALVDDPSVSVEQVSLIGEQERQQLEFDWNASDVVYFDESQQDERLVHYLFEQQVSRTPEAVAVIFEDVELNYKELNAQANRLAHYLIGQGVGPDTVVGICLERSAEMMVGLLGILKAGGAYVPLDPNYPEARLGYMLDDTGISQLVTQSSLVGQLPLTVQQVICLDTAQTREQLSGYPDVNPHVMGLTPHHLAYVIYTSGSTGQPKGVMVEHHSVCNFLKFGEQDFMYEQIVGSVVSSPIAFDATVQSLYVPLISGGYVELLPEDVLPLESLADYLF
ncbi:AMP-binding protein [Paraneptunicella aestuarii]|uniref:non-ribosomal peptide synthetase n=1 Tax=Paraneptunicella aestuarii TaxID=2831148 RepID=UPI0022B71B3D|nr:condensation domain-containing protein [Paraneptunicella aestuarii]UAA37212.1 AMP-binding protein [Paraneptunicella aestuarii]